MSSSARRIAVLGLALMALWATPGLQAQTGGFAITPAGPSVQLPAVPRTPKLPKPRALAQPTADSISVAYFKGQVPVAPDAVTGLGTDLFGDKINLFNGSFSFEHTDVELPGNSALPVALVRHHTPGRQPLVRGAMGDWDLSTPRIEGTFSVAAGWVPAFGSVANRCSAFGAPPDVSVQGVDGAVDFAPHEYWHGTHLAIPGQGNQEILTRASGNAQAPSDGQTYPLVTSQNWQIRCLPSVQNAAGQGFLAVSPQGVRYRFDWMASRAASAIRKGAYLPRRDFYLMATEVSDRFGNWVRYSYDSANPLNLTRIESSDGRVITLGYAAGRVSTVSDGTRTWTYSYAATTDLQSVQLPDGSRWQFNLRPLMDQNTNISDGWTDCDSDPDPAQILGGVGTITHPSGAVGSFSAAGRVHGRNNVTRVCTYDLMSGWTNGNVWPRATLNLALLSKQISGPGLPTMTWQYSGGGSAGQWAPCNGCADRKIVTVTEPSGAVTRHSVCILWRVNEGQLLRVEEGWNGSSALRVTDFSYQDASGQAFPDGYGNSVNFMTDWVSTRNRPLRAKSISQQGVAFNWTANSFDFRARPVTVTKAGSGGSRVDTSAYQDFTVPWVLGQVASVSSGSTVPVENSYDSLGQLLSHKQFGLVQFTQTYWSDGTLKTRADGKGNTTSFSNYHRGIPRNIAFPLSVSVSGVVNNIGRLTRITDPLGQNTSYGYDAMGRLASITPPGGFTPTTLSFAPAASGIYGLPAGHWRQVVSKGNARTETYFDALWRPVMTRTFDALNEAATRQVTVKGYDAGGRLAFESYPLRDAPTVAITSPGQRFQHDVLNRPTRLAADSELGELLTHTAYLSGFQTRTTNPRGQASTQSFWALDNPAEAQLAGLQHASGPGLPQGISVSIQRDAFGKPTSITRGDGSVSLTRSYVYDLHQRLCKTLEPELIATVQQWDAAGNLAWIAPGVNQPGSTCDAASVPGNAKISHSHDALNRLTTTSYGDGSNGIARTYYPDGKLHTLQSGDATWTYAYNALRQLSSESLSYNGQTYTFIRGYNANGDPSSLRYPSGLTVDYAPNALGQPTQVRNAALNLNYANSISHHPGGQIAGFTYGNGLARSLSLNTRQMPLSLQHGSLVKDQFSYDANGNVTAISDQAEGGLTNRSMGYDALDRLSTANGIWGSGSYGYDALDNLRTASVGGRATSVAFGSRNLPLSLSTNGGAAQAIGHDARGNVSQAGAQSFSFDLGNRLLSSSGNSYGYDGHGRRARIISSDGSTRYQVYGADGQLLWSTNAGGGRATSHTAYIQLGGQQIAEVDSVKGVQYVHTDLLGSPVAHSNASGGLIRRTRYEPYGGIAGGAAPSAASSQVGFTGHVQDLETGLVYMQQRYYVPVVGRFLSVDPVVTDAQTGGFFGRYHYANNNPYRFTDPDGRSPCTGTRIASGCPEGGGVAFTHSSHGGAPLARTVANFVDGGHGQKFEQAVKAGEPGKATAHFVAAVAYSAMSVAAVPIRGVGALAANGVRAGEAGAFGSLKGIKGDGLTANHMPQAAAGRTGYNEGGALVMTQAEHVATRTYGSKGVGTLQSDAGLSFRDVLARDIRDVRSIVGRTYNQGLRDLTDYYRRNFPDLMGK